MEKFDYKVLWNKRQGVHEDWFERGGEPWSCKITTQLLSRYGAEGWEVAATLQMVAGPTHKVILKRRRESEGKSQ